MTNHYFNEDGKNVFGIEDNSSVKFVQNKWSPTGRDAIGNALHSPSFSNVCVNPADSFQWMIDEGYLICRANDGNDYFIGPDFSGWVYVDGVIWTVSDGKPEHKLEGEGLWVMCEDDGIRHPLPFTSMEEAKTFSHWGHCCTNSHIAFSKENIVGTHLTEKE